MTTPHISIDVTTDMRLLRTNSRYNIYLDARDVKKVIARYIKRKISTAGFTRKDPLTGEIVHGLLKSKLPNEYHPLTNPAIPWDYNSEVIELYEGDHVERFEYLNRIDESDSAFMRYDEKIDYEWGYREVPVSLERSNMSFEYFLSERIKDMELVKAKGKRVKKNADS